MAKNKSNKLFESSLVKEAFIQSFVKLNPRILLRNPVMFTVEIGTAIMLGVCIWILTGEGFQGSFAYNFAIFIILFVLLLNFLIPHLTNAYLDAIIRSLVFSLFFTVIVYKLVISRDINDLIKTLNSQYLKGWLPLK